VLGLNSFSANWQMIIKGTIVVAAVVIQRPDLLAGVVARLRRRDEPRSPDDLPARDRTLQDTPQDTPQEATTKEHR